MFDALPPSDPAAGPALPASLPTDDAGGIDWSRTHVLVAGLGLIGGAVCRSLRARHPGVRLTALARNAAKYESAVAAGIVDAVVESPPAERVHVAVACTPVDAVVGTLAAIQEVQPEAFLTDAGSAKAAILEAAAERLPDPERFLPAHPLAGSERTGWEASTVALLDGAVCVLTPTADPPHQAEPATANREVAAAIVASFWAACGMTVRYATSRSHDRWLSQTSHMPHVVAAAIANAVQAPTMMMASGLRDTTRVAAGDAGLWAEIVGQNAEAIDESLAEVERQIAAVRAAIAGGDRDAIRRWLHAAATARQGWASDLGWS